MGYYRRQHYSTDISPSELPDRHIFTYQQLFTTPHYRILPHVPKEMTSKEAKEEMKSLTWLLLLAFKPSFRLFQQTQERSTCFLLGYLLLHLPNILCVS